MQEAVRRTVLKVWRQRTPQPATGEPEKVGRTTVARCREYNNHRRSFGTNVATNIRQGPHVRRASARSSKQTVCCGPVVVLTWRDLLRRGGEAICCRGGRGVVVTLGQVPDEGTNNGGCEQRGRLKEPTPPRTRWQSSAEPVDDASSTNAWAFHLHRKPVEERRVDLAIPKAVPQVLVSLDAVGTALRHDGIWTDSDPALGLHTGCRPRRPRWECHVS